jgi:hypothetical protein
VEEPRLGAVRDGGDGFRAGILRVALPAIGRDAAAEKSRQSARSCGAWLFEG